MFCPNCGSQLSGQDNFCARCGQQRRELPQPSAQSRHSPTRVPTLGVLKTKWWTDRPVNAAFPPPYDWLNGGAILHVFVEHLAFQNGKEHRSAAADVVTSGAMAGFGLAGALVGGAFGVARSIKDNISNRIQTQEDEKLQSLFESGALVWCSKADAEIWEIKQKRFFGLATPSRYALYCPLESTAGNLKFLFPLTQTQESLLDPYKSLGCTFSVKAQGLSEDEADRAFTAMFDEFFCSDNAQAHR